MNLKYLKKMGLERQTREEPNGRNHSVPTIVIGFRVQFETSG